MPTIKNVRSRPARSETGHIKSKSFSPAQARVLEAALMLFNEHGINGTSLQLIADTVGVTKAAVYHQFPAKEDIVLAICELVFDGLRDLMDEAESQPSPQKVGEVLIDRLIDLAVIYRNSASVMHNDPIMLRLINEHGPFRRVMQRLDRLLMGTRDSADARVAAAMLITAIGGAVRHPLVADVDDETLRAQLARVARGLYKNIK
jgi:AcrR family transcriptional regulator